MKNHIKKFQNFLLESREESEDSSLSITLSDFKRMLRHMHKSWLRTIDDEDDYLDEYEYYSEIARELEEEYGITRDWDTGKFEYTSRNTNWTDPYDDDEDDYDGW